MAEEKKRKVVAQNNRVIVEQLCFLDNLLETLMPDIDVADKKQHAKAIVRQMCKQYDTLDFDYDKTSSCERAAAQWMLAYVKVFEKRFKMMKLIFANGRDPTSFNIPAPAAPGEYPAE